MSQATLTSETSDKNVLTYSALNTFRNCPRKYKHRYVDNLRPRMKVESLSFGSVIHSAIEIGAVNEYSRTIWSLHEFGGSQRPKPRLLKVQTFRVGDFGPVRVKQINEYKTEMIRARLNSEAQAQRATELVREENQRRMADARKRRRYPKRPSMGPALETQRSRLPKFWADSVRA